MGSTYSPPRGLFLATSKDFDMAMDKLQEDPAPDVESGGGLGLPLTSRDRIRVLSDHSWEGVGTS